jgi:hypothetical protein
MSSTKAGSQSQPEDVERSSRKTRTSRDQSSKYNQSTILMLSRSEGNLEYRHRERSESRSKRGTRHSTIKEHGHETRLSSKAGSTKQIDGAEANSKKITISREQDRGKRPSDRREKSKKKWCHQSESVLYVSNTHENAEGRHASDSHIAQRRSAAQRESRRERGVTDHKRRRSRSRSLDRARISQDIVKSSKEEVEKIRDRSVERARRLSGSRSEINASRLTREFGDQSDGTITEAGEGHSTEDTRDPGESTARQNRRDKAADDGPQKRQRSRSSSLDLARRSHKAGNLTKEQVDRIMRRNAVTRGGHRDLSDRCLSTSSDTKEKAKRRSRSLSVEHQRPGAVGLGVKETRGSSQEDHNNTGRSEARQSRKDRAPSSSMAGDGARSAKAVQSVQQDHPEANKEVQEEARPDSYVSKSKTSHRDGRQSRNDRSSISKKQTRPRGRSQEHSVNRIQEKTKDKDESTPAARAQETSTTASRVGNREHRTTTTRSRYAVDENKPAEEKSGGGSHKDEHAKAAVRRKDKEGKRRRESPQESRELGLREQSRKCESERQQRTVDKQLIHSQPSSSSSERNERKVAFNFEVKSFGAAPKGILKKRAPAAAKKASRPVATKAGSESSISFAMNSGLIRKQTIVERRSASMSNIGAAEDATSHSEDTSGTR